MCWLRLVFYYSLFLSYLEIRIDVLLEHMRQNRPKQLQKANYPMDVTSSLIYNHEN